MDDDDWLDSDWLDGDWLDGLVDDWDDCELLLDRLKELGLLVDKATVLELDSLWVDELDADDGVLVDMPIVLEL